MDSPGPVVHRPLSPPVSVLARPPLLSDRSTTSSSVTSSSTGIATPTTAPSNSSRRISTGLIANLPPSSYQQTQRNSGTQKLFDGEDTRLEFLHTLRVNKADAEWEFIDAKDIPLIPDLEQTKRRSFRSKKLSNASSKMSMMEPQRPTPPKKSGGGFFRRLTQSQHDSPTSQGAEQAPPPPPQLPRISMLETSRGDVSPHGGLLSGTQFSPTSASGPTPSPPLNHALPSLPPGAAAPEPSVPDMRAVPIRKTSAGFKVNSRPQPGRYPNDAPSGPQNGVPKGHANGFMHTGPNGVHAPMPTMASRPPPPPGGSYGHSGKGPVTAALAAPPMSAPMSPPMSPDQFYFNGPHQFSSTPQQTYSRPPLLNGPSRSPAGAPYLPNPQARPNGASYEIIASSAQRPQVNGHAGHPGHSAHPGQPLPDHMGNRFAQQPPTNYGATGPMVPQPMGRPVPIKQNSLSETQNGRPLSPTSSHGHSMSAHSSAHGHGPMTVRPMAPVVRPPVSYNARPPMANGPYPPGAMPPNSMPEPRIAGGIISPPPRGASSVQSQPRPPSYPNYRPPPQNGMRSPPMPAQQNGMRSPPVPAHQRLHSPPQVNQPIMPPQVPMVPQVPMIPPVNTPQQARSPSQQQLGTFTDSPMVTSPAPMSAVRSPQAQKLQYGGGVEARMSPPTQAPRPLDKSPPMQSPAPLDKSPHYVPRPLEKSPGSQVPLPLAKSPPAQAPRPLAKSPSAQAASLPIVKPSPPGNTTALSPVSSRSPTAQFTSNSGGTFQVISSSKLALSQSPPDVRQSLPLSPSSAGSLDSNGIPTRPRIVIPTGRNAQLPEAKPYMSPYRSTSESSAGAPPPSSSLPSGPVAAGHTARGPAPLSRPERSPYRAEPPPLTEEPLPMSPDRGAGSTAAAAGVATASAAAALAAETRARTMRTEQVPPEAVPANSPAIAMRQEQIGDRREPMVQAKPATPVSAPVAVQPSANTLPDAPNAPSYSTKNQDDRQRYGGLAARGPPPTVIDQHPPRGPSTAEQAKRRAVSSPMSAPGGSVSNCGSPLGPNRAPIPPPIQTQRSVSAHPRVSSISGATSQSPTASTHSGSTSSVIDRPRPKIRKDMSTTILMKQPRVVISLLPYLNINSFLNLLGSDDEIRKYISGEMVGRWVMREWGVTMDRERQRSWPGLTVWEGFLESLLHDPAVYSTYPAQYHNLLRHLSLSHTLVVLFLRTLPASAFPYSPPVPFDDDISLPALHKSSSVTSFQGMHRGPGASRAASIAGSDSGSMGGARMPRRERVTELVMPEPLSAGPKSASATPSLSQMMLPSTNGRLRKRRGSIGSISGTNSGGGFGRKRSNSVSSVITERLNAPSIHAATVMPQGKAAFPPVSYPNAKRYEFRRYGEPSLLSPSGTQPASSRPSSIMSAQSSVRGFGMSRSRPPSTRAMSDMLPIPPPIGGGRGKERSSVASSEGRSSRRSDHGGSHNGTASPVGRRWDSPTNGGSKYEPAFDRPPPYMVGRAPILRVFVPVSSQVPRWPSSEGAAAAWRELAKCGADRRMRLGDLVVNTALHKPSNTEHVLIYVPFVPHKLVPLEYVHCATGHLPHYLDAFAVSPIYYDPFLPTPQIIYLDFAPYAAQAMQSIRLAYDRRDVTVASGARVAAKRYVHVAGVEVQPGDRVAPEWVGMLTLESEGTAEGRQDMEARFGSGDPQRAVMGPWEVVRERSMMGSLWLRLVREAEPQRR